jgi:hypothetical protein
MASRNRFWTSTEEIAQAVRNMGYSVEETTWRMGNPAYMVTKSNRSAVLVRYGLAFILDGSDTFFAEEATNG